MNIDAPFLVDLANGPDGTRITLAGRVDRDAEDSLLAAFAQAVDDGATRVVLDFGEATYINSSGLAAIVAVLADARSRDIAVAARRLTPHYLHLFQITRITDLVEVETEPGDDD